MSAVRSSTPVSRRASSSSESSRFNVVRTIPPEIVCIKYTSFDASSSAGFRSGLRADQLLDSALRFVLVRRQLPDRHCVSGSRIFREQSSVVVDLPEMVAEVNGKVNERICGSHLSLTKEKRADKLVLTEAVKYEVQLCYRLLHLSS
jgi:hypothetical protein